MSGITQRKFSQDPKNTYNRQFALDDADAHNSKAVLQHERRRHARFDVKLGRGLWSGDLYHLVIRERDEGIFHVWLESDAGGGASPGLGASSEDPAARNALLQMVREAAGLAWPELSALTDEQIKFL